MLAFRSVSEVCQWTMPVSRAPWAPRVPSHVDELLDTLKFRALSPPRESAPSRCGQRRKQFVRIASALFHRADSTRRNSLSLLPYPSQQLILILVSVVPSCRLLGFVSFTDLSELILTCRRLRSGPALELTRPTRERASTDCRCRYLSTALLILLSSSLSPLRFPPCWPFLSLRPLCHSSYWSPTSLMPPISLF